MSIFVVKTGKKDGLCHLEEKNKDILHIICLFVSFEKENLYVHFDIDVMTIQTNMKKEIKSKYNEQLAKAKAVTTGRSRKRRKK